jgi:hypothetical protein
VDDAGSAAMDRAARLSLSCMRGLRRRRAGTPGAGRGAKASSVSALASVRCAGTGLVWGISLGFTVHDRFSFPLSMLTREGRESYSWALPKMLFSAIGYASGLKFRAFAPSNERVSCRQGEPSSSWRRLASPSEIWDYPVTVSDSIIGAAPVACQPSCPRRGTTAIQNLSWMLRGSRKLLILWWS